MKLTPELPIFSFKFIYLSFISFSRSFWLKGRRRRERGGRKRRGKWRDKGIVIWNRVDRFKKSKILKSKLD